MKTVARLSAEDRSDLFRNTANRMQMSDAIRADNSTSQPVLVLKENVFLLIFLI